jgi:hypothetical protein
MLHVIAGIFSIALSAASADAEKWAITRDGVEVRRHGAVVRVALPGWQWAGPPYGRVLSLGTGPRGEVLATSDCRRCGVSTHAASQ